MNCLFVYITYNLVTNDCDKISYVIYQVNSYILDLMPLCFHIWLMIQCMIYGLLFYLWFNVLILIWCITDVLVHYLQVNAALVIILFVCVELLLVILLMIPCISHNLMHFLVFNILFMSWFMNYGLMYDLWFMAYIESSFIFQIISM